jgi:hypothetical protein
MSLEVTTVTESENIMETAITALKEIVEMQDRVTEDRFTAVITRAKIALSAIQMISEKFNATVDTTDK